MTDPDTRRVRRQIRPPRRVIRTIHPHAGHDAPPTRPHVAE
jgi:hypothetical protein